MDGDRVSREGGHRLEHRRTVVVALVLCAYGIAYLGFAALAALKTPLWQAPDEPSHYLYVQSVARSGRIPTASLDNFAQYEAIQPPVYYFVVSPVYRLFEGAGIGRRLHALRIATLLLGLPMIPLTYLIARRSVPSRFKGSAIWISLTATGLATLIPQRIATYASVENDVLAELGVSVALLLSLRIIQSDGELRLRALAGLGIVGGLALLTKLTAFPALLVIGLAVLVRLRKQRASWTRILASEALVAGVALAVISPWLAHNLRAYGDLLGFRRFNELWSPYFVKWNHVKDHWSFLFVLSFKSFWGILGWLTWYAPGAVYWTAGGLTMLGGTGAIVFLGAMLIRRGRERDLSVLVCAVPVAAIAVWVLWFNLSQFWQPQGRYFFAPLAGTAVVFVLGLREWLPHNAFRAVATLTLATVVALNSVVFFDVALKIKPYPTLCQGWCGPAPVALGPSDHENGTVVREAGSPRRR